MTDDLDELISAATPATPDIICWLHAAVAPRPNGRLHIRHCAEVLGVSETSIRRWIKAAHERDFNETAQKMLDAAALQRGDGDYLWPPLDPASVQRHQELRRAALATYDRPYVAALPPVTVSLFYRQKARVFGVTTSAARTGVQILNRLTVSNKWEAQLVKFAALEARHADTCIVPRSMIPRSRTEVWLKRGGPLELAALDHVAAAHAAIAPAREGSAR